jgi:geranylgeranyl pyrophosphate synthase
MAENEDMLKFLEEKRALIDSIIKKYLPEKFDKKYLEWALGKPSYAYNTESLNKVLAEPIWEYLNRGGKRWRPALFIIVVEALGGDMKKAKEFLPIVEMLHNGSIIIDDIEDDSDMRRGKPCVHKIHGLDVAINAGNFMYFIPLLSLIKNRGSFDDKTIIRAWEACSQEMIRIHVGQGSDIAWHRGLADADNITEEEYLQMCAYKTGVLARLAARLGVIFSSGSEEIEEKLGRLAESIGIAFQIRDDILNIQPTEKWGKEFGDDINEGKRTLLVIHTLKKASDRDRKRLIEILNMHTKDLKLITEAVEIIKKHGSIEYAKEFAMKIVRKAWSEVDPLLKESKAKNDLRSLVNFLVEREI